MAYSKYDLTTQTLTQISILATVDHFDNDNNSTISEIDGTMYLTYRDDDESSIIKIDTLGNWSSIHSDSTTEFTHIEHSQNKLYIITKNEGEFIPGEWIILNNLAVYDIPSQTLENTYPLDSNMHFEEGGSTYNQINNKLYIIGQVENYVNSVTGGEWETKVLSIDALGNTQTIYTDTMGEESSTQLAFLEAHTNETPAIAQCDSYSWNGTTYTSTGTYTWQGNNSLGCDSVVTLNLLINNSTVSTTSATACDNYSWNGTTYTSTGTYTWTTTNAVGCDSTATLNLTINNSDLTTSSESACDSYVWDGVTHTASGSYTNNYTNASGCDSTHTLTLTINNSETATSSESACDSYVWDGVTYTASGSYTNNYNNTLGCDSIHTLNLTIKSSSLSVNSATACDNYSWNGTTYTSTGTYTWTTTNAVGCDSTATLNLTINNSDLTTSSESACNSYVWDGVTYTASGSYTNNYTNASGCDSTHTLTLTINNSETTTSSESACDSYVWDGVTYTASGSYTNNYTNTSGCDSTHTLTLTVNNSETTSSLVTTCDNYIWDGVIYTSSGSYSNVYNNTQGCDSSHTLELTINKVITSISQDGDSLYATTLPLDASENTNWYNIQTIDGETKMWLMKSNSANFTPMFDCSYFITTEDENGCVDTSEIYLYGATASRIGNPETYPNPTDGKINIQFENTKNQLVKFNLVDGSGITVAEYITSDNQMEIDISKYPSGTYYLYFNSENNERGRGCNNEKTQRKTNKIILNK